MQTRVGRQMQPTNSFVAKDPFRAKDGGRNCGLARTSPYIGHHGARLSAATGMYRRDVLCSVKKGALDARVHASRRLGEEGA